MKGWMISPKEKERGSFPIVTFCINLGKVLYFYSQAKRFKKEGRVVTSKCVNLDFTALSFNTSHLDESKDFYYAQASIVFIATALETYFKLKMEYLKKKEYSIITNSEIKRKGLWKAIEDSFNTIDINIWDCRDVKKSDIMRAIAFRNAMIHEGGFLSERTGKKLMIENREIKVFFGPDPSRIETSIRTSIRLVNHIELVVHDRFKWDGSPLQIITPEKIL